MLGYVTINKNELKIREYDIYQSYYCGLCRSVGKRIGQLPRAALHYDSVFLALLLASLDDEKDKIVQERCFMHPIKKRPVAGENRAVDYAADMMVILAYHKFGDDLKDERSLRAFGGKLMLAPSYRKLRRKYIHICGAVENALAGLSSLEKERSGSIDKTAGAFADIMEAVFTGFCEDKRVNWILAQFGRNLGKWVYLMDALDDYPEDIEKEHYNPLIYRKNGIEETGVLLYNYLGETLKAYDLLEIKKNSGIIENILLMGLRSRSDGILKERMKKTNERSV